VTGTLLVLIKLSVAGLILAIGMGSTLRDLLYLWRRPGLLLRSLLAMYVAVPLVALLVARSLTLPTPVEVAILVLAISAGAPLLPRKLIHLGNDAYVFSLVVTSSLLAIVTIPAWLTVLAPLHGRTAELTAGDVAGVVVPSFLAPLVLGMVVRWLAPEASERIADRLLAVVGVIFTLCALALLVTNLGLLLAAGWTAISTLAGLSLAALVIGHVLGGPDPEDRTALAVCCATRHVGLAVLVAAAVPGPRTAVLVAAYIVASAVVCIPYVQWRRRVSTTMSEVGTNGALEPDAEGKREGERR
jgi:BASS family bile acid:Na+ symporter